MKLYEGATVVLLIIGIAGIIGVVSAQFLGDDNPVEETAEKVIEIHTGIDLDLTPESEEK